MKFMRKQLIKTFMQNKIFVTMLLLLTVFTSFLYFFVHFSVDGNLRVLQSLTKLSQQQELYLVALHSNTILIRVITLVFTGLTAFVFVMFFYRFFRANKKQIGCLKSLGFKDKSIRAQLVWFTGGVSLIGAVIGLIGGYFASDILNNASSKSYLVADLEKAVSIPSFLTGIFAPMLCFCMVTYLVYYLVAGKEPGVFMSGITTPRFTGVLKFADRCANSIPVKDKLPVRLALRKPISLILIMAAVMGFSTMFIMAYSLTLSSAKVYQAQTEGHNYEYEAVYTEMQHGMQDSEQSLYYLSQKAAVVKAGSKTEIKQEMVGIDATGPLLELEDTVGNFLDAPASGSAYIGPGLEEVYGIHKGDYIDAAIGGVHLRLQIAGVAANAKSDSIYLARVELADALKVAPDAYNGELSVKRPEGGAIQTRTERLDELERASVSNKMSAVINQVIGCVIGIILIFLALFINFQDSTRDVLILHLMGYRIKVIRKMLIDIYRPVILLFYVLTLWPSIEIVRSIQRSLSIQTEDYMPFQSNIFVILGVFVLLNFIYLLVQFTFNRGIRRTIANDDIAEFTM